MLCQLTRRVAFSGGFESHPNLRQRSAFVDFDLILANARNGANRGIRHALERGAERVLVLNNDATLAPGCLALLEDELARAPQVGIVGPRICLAGEPQTLWCAGGRLTFRQNLSTLIGFHEPEIG